METLWPTGIEAVPGSTPSHPRAQPQPPGIRWSACHPGHIPGREWRKVLATCLLRKFPTSCHFHCPLWTHVPSAKAKPHGHTQLKENWEFYSSLQATLCPAKPLGCLEGWGLLGQTTTSFHHNCHHFSHFSLFYLHQGSCFTAVFASRNGLSDWDVG